MFRLIELVVTAMSVAPSKNDDNSIWAWTSKPFHWICRLSKRHCSGKFTLQRSNMAMHPRDDPEQIDFIGVRKDQRFVSSKRDHNKINCISSQANKIHSLQVI